MSEPLREQLDLSILIVGYNSTPHLEKALGAIALAVEGFSYEVRFVNNGTDDSEELVKNCFHEAEILATKGNIGFGAGNNYLSEGARGKYLLLLNPDTCAFPGAISLLLKAALAKPDFGILGGISEDCEGQALLLSCLEFPTFGKILRGLLGLSPPALPESYGSEPIAVEAVSGGFMLISRAAWEQLGGFDEAFFLYAEELDLCRRWHDSGGKIGLVSAARIEHDVGSGAAVSSTRVLFSMRGAATYYLKHFNWIYSRLCILTHWLSGLVRFGLGAILSPFSKRWLERRKGMRQVALKPWLWWGGW